MADGHALCLQALQQAPAWPDLRLASAATIPLGWMGSHRWTWDGAGVGFVSRLDVALFMRRGSGTLAPGILVRPCLQPRVRPRAVLEPLFRSWLESVRRLGLDERVVGNQRVAVPQLEDVLFVPPRPWPSRRPTPLSAVQDGLDAVLAIGERLLEQGDPRRGRLSELPQLRDALHARPPADAAWMPEDWERVRDFVRARGATPSWTPEPLATQIAEHLPDGREVRHWWATRTGTQLALGRFARQAFALHLLSNEGGLPERLPYDRHLRATAATLRDFAHRQERRRDESRRRRRGNGLRHIGPWAVVTGQDVVPAAQRLVDAGQHFRVLLEWMRTPGFCETLRVVTDNGPANCRYLVSERADWDGLLEDRHGQFAVVRVRVAATEPGWGRAVALADEPVDGDVAVVLAGFVPSDGASPDKMAARVRDRLLGKDVGEISDFLVYGPSVGWHRAPSPAERRRVWLAPTP